MYSKALPWAKSNCNLYSFRNRICLADFLFFGSCVFIFKGFRDLRTGQKRQNKTGGGV